MQSFEKLCDQALDFLSKTQQATSISYLSAEIKCNIETCFLITDRLINDGYISCVNDTYNIMGYNPNEAMFYISGNGYSFIANGGYSERFQQSALNRKKNKLEVSKIGWDKYISLISLLISLIALWVTYKKT